jgi:crotonobetainyl-CoA:carnitine CoA-transferase CaiB-like acyl-CoA transferase
VLERIDLFADERFATNAWRIANRDALDAEIEPIFAAIDRQEAIRRLNASQIAWGKLTEVSPTSAVCVRKNFFERFFALEPPRAEGG